jgi:alkylhydroperoxidase family enzyme
MRPTTCPIRAFIAAVAIVAAGVAPAVPQEAAPAAVPENRAAMLEALSALQGRAPRLPAPPPEARAAQPAGPLGVVNNALFRSHYLPAELRPGGFSRRPDPALGIDDVLAVELFWIVSRVNDCHYCLGHQEAKLAAAGVTERSLLALDTDWTAFDPGRRAAFAFARKLTTSPQEIGAADIDSLRPFFEPRQILGIVFLVSRYNSTNRWTDSLGLPQEEHREFVSGLSPAERSRPSIVAVRGFPPRPGVREHLADAVTWRTRLDRHASRVPRLPLADEAAAAALLFTPPAAASPATDAPAPPLAAAGALRPRLHERLLAQFPIAAGPLLLQLRAAETVGELPQPLREKIAMTAALADRAWYMQHRGRRALAARGLDDAAILTACGLPGEGGTDQAPGSSAAAERAALAFARRLTVDPQGTTDADIATLLEHFSPRQVAEIVHHVGTAAFLDRLTEAAGLGWTDDAE